MNELNPAADLPLGHWLKRAYLALSNHLNELLRPYDLTYSQWQVLALLGRRTGTGAAGSATQRDVQNSLRVEAATLTGIVDGLVRRGWVVRRENGADRRVNELTLTPSGQAMYAELDGWVCARVRERLHRGLDPERVSLVREALEQMVRNLEADPK